MTYDEMIRALRDRSALIVHFSHYADMGRGVVFPADLYAAAVNSRIWVLSCCLVWPTHQMSLPGYVGIVLRPRSLASIVSVKSSDSGSATQRDGSETGGGDGLNKESLDRSFDVSPGDYNEWRVREADVVGVYWEKADDGQVYAKKLVPIPDPDTGRPIDHSIDGVPISVDEIHKAFPDLPVYSRFEGRIVATNIPGSVVYPWSMTGADPA